MIKTDRITEIIKISTLLPDDVFFISEPKHAA